MAVRQLEDQETYSIAEVVQMTGKSESTVRRQIGDMLQLAPGDGPKRVTRLSVEAYIHELAKRMPRVPIIDTSASFLERPLSPHERALTNTIAELEREIAELKRERDRLSQENEKLRHTTQALRHAHSIVSDELGAYTSPTIPNN